MLSKKYRLSLRTAHQNFRLYGRKFYTPLFTLIYFKNPQNKIIHPRFAVLLNKKTSPKAVTRNKIKRFFYDAIQEILPHLAQPIDVLVIPNPKSIAIDKTELNKAVQSALKQLFNF